MGISDIINYRLQKEDVELLQKLDRLEAYDILRSTLSHKPNARETEVKEVYRVFNSEVPINTIADLLTKYAYWQPSFINKTRKFIFEYPVPVDVFCLFRKDARKFYYTDIIVEGPNPRSGYEKWKQ